MLVFYLPCESGEKITLGISLLVALLVFYLLLVELIPPTSLVLPLLGKYLLFTLVLVNLSIVVTICISNVYHRNKDNNKMSNWTRDLFIRFMPKILRIKRPKFNDKFETREKLLGGIQYDVKEIFDSKKLLNYPPSIQKALNGIEFIRNRLNKIDEEKMVNNF